MNEKDRYESARRRMRRDNTIFLALITIFGIAIIAEYWLGIGGMAFVATILMFVLLTLFAVIRFTMADRLIKNMPEYVLDERLKKIDDHARSRSWYVTFCLVCLMVGLTAFHIIDLSTNNSLMLILLVMGYSGYAFNWYYSRKGDVE